MSFDKLGRGELEAILNRLVTAQQERQDQLKRENAEQSERLVEHQRLVEELQIHQVELELQNRELRAAQVALEQSRDRYSELYDFAPVPYFTFDGQGVVREVNLTGASMLGRDRAQLLGQPFVALAGLSDSAPFWRHLAEAGAGPAQAELSLAPPGRRELQVEIRSVPALAVDGGLLGVRSSFFDITLRREAEAERARALASEQRLRLQLEALDRAGRALTEAIGAPSLALHEVLRVVVEQARALTGARYAAVGLGADPARPFAPWVVSGLDGAASAHLPTPPRPVGVLGLVACQGQPVRIGDLRAHVRFAGLPPGHATMTSFLGVPVRHGGRLVGSLYVTEKVGAAEFDADDQHGVEMLAERLGVAMEIATQVERAEAAIQARDTLLAVVSHDLRSPVSSLLLAASALERRFSDAASTPLKIVARAARHMNRLIEDLAQGAGQPGAGWSLELGSQDPAALARETVAMLEPVAQARGNTLRLEVATGLPEVACDGERITEALLNLVGNAIKFSPAGAEIVVRVAPDAGAVRFTVVDQGPGIAADELPHLFERYWRGRHADGPGSGLGLFIAQGVVEAHGAHIEVDTRVGAGTSFWFRLRPAPAAAP